MKRLLRYGKVAGVLFAALVVWAEQRPKSDVLQNSAAGSFVPSASALGAVGQREIEPGGSGQLLLGGATGVYEQGFFWRRRRDWTVRPSSDNYTTNGNPDDDQLGTPVWHAVKLTGGGMGDATPWWSNYFGTTLVWDPSWYGSDPVWAGGDNIGPPISRYSGDHGTHPSTYNNVPGVWWINPLTNPALIEVRGTLVLYWSGSSGGLYYTVDVVVVQYSAGDGGIRVLWHTAIDKPTRDGSRERRYLPLVLTNLVVQPGDRLLLTYRGRTQGGDYWTDCRDELDVIYVAPFYARGHVWNRTGEWTRPPDSEHKSSAWNPMPDGKGMPVWHYVDLSGDGLGSATPWWSNVVGADLQWDTSWWGSEPVWAGGDDTAPAIGQSNLTHIGGSGYTHVPGVWWISPSNGPMRVSLKGGVRVRWHGTGDIAQPVDVELAFAQYEDATRTVRLLHSQRVSKPHNNTVPESLHVPVHIPGIVVQPRDRILRTLRAVESMSSGRWIILYDPMLDIVLDVPHAETAQVRTQVFNVGFTALAPGQTAVVERAASLGSNGWQACESIVPTGISHAWSEPLSPAATQRFFRILQHK